MATNDLEKTKLILTALVMSSIYITGFLLLFTYLVYPVSHHIIAESGGGVWWLTSPAGSLFPFPQNPGRLMALSRLSPVDSAVYYSLIKTNILLILDGVATVSDCFFLWKLVRAVGRGGR